MPMPIAEHLAVSQALPVYLEQEFPLPAPFRH